MPNHTRVVIGGVDTHGRTHHAAVLDQQGRLLGDREFPADRGGYRQLLSSVGHHGQVGVVGVEGSGSYGTGLAGYLGDQQVRVVEVDRPDRRIRRQRGKSDPIDAEAAAQRHQPTKLDRDRALREALRQLSRDHPRWGPVVFPPGEGIGRTRPGAGSRSR